MPGLRPPNAACRGLAPEAALLRCRTTGGSEFGSIGADAALLRSECRPAPNRGAMPIKPIKVPALLWIRLLRELRRHSHGRRESGAFLLGRRSRERRRICSFVCYDDLDPDSGRSAAIAFHARGQAALWETLPKDESRRRRRRAYPSGATRRPERNRSDASDDSRGWPHCDHSSIFCAYALVVAPCCGRVRVSRKLRMARTSRVAAP